ELGDFAAAMTHVQAAQALAGMLGERGAEAWLAVRASMLYRQTGDLTRAQLWSAHAWRVSTEIAHPRCQIEAALELTCFICQQGAFAEAYHWAQRADELMNASAFTRYRGAIALLWSLLHLHSNCLDAATNAAADALEALHTGGEYRYLAVCHALGAVIAYRQGDECSAHWQLEQARLALLARADRIPDPAARTRFLEATPLRRQLHHHAELPALDALWRA
ncbi:MAG: hypothetical protein ACRDH2_18285, partial [Anaerolineales bacterium]